MAQLRPSAAAAGLLPTTAYDRSPILHPAESMAIARVIREWSRGTKAGRWPPAIREPLERLIRPLHDVLARSDTRKRSQHLGVRLILQAMDRRQVAYWGWSEADWLELLGDSDLRQHVMACAYLLGGFCTLHQNFLSFWREQFARKLFGSAAVDTALDYVREQMGRWGHGASLTATTLPRVLTEIMLINPSPRLADITPEVVATLLASCPTPSLRSDIAVVIRSLVGMGALSASVMPLIEPKGMVRPTPPADVAAEWQHWCQRWRDTSALEPVTRKTAHYAFRRAGRWLAAVHPDVVSPAQWTRELAAE